MTVLQNHTEDINHVAVAVGRAQIGSRTVRAFDKQAFRRNVGEIIGRITDAIDNSWVPGGNPWWMD